MPTRRPRPAILLSVIAATVVLLPWAVHGTADQRPKPAAQPVVTQQPLTDVGGGVTVREVGQDTPFSVVALTADDLDGTAVKVRAVHADGSWGPWYDADPLDGPATDRSARAGTEPVYVGETTRVQISVTRPHTAPPVPAPAPPGPALGYRPVNVERPLLPTVNAILITAPTAGPIGPLPTAAIPAGVPPKIVSRAAWGADESMTCGPPRYDDRVRAAVVHHTAGSNDYTPEQSAAIVRAIYAYHTRTMGWCDMAYNALVDKYGQVFEGRAGGMSAPVIGSHTGGFNTDTWGVALMGDYTHTPPGNVALTAVGRLLGWRLGLAGLDPHGTVTLTSAGGGYTTYAAGTPVRLPLIFAHRDVGNTECPGDAAYALMGTIRDIAARYDDPPTLEDGMRGGAIWARWQQLGGEAGRLGAPSSPETPGEDGVRYVRFARGVVYWSPDTGAQPVEGAIYDAWASLGFERGPLGMPTSAEIQAPEWVTQNFTHGTLNFDREHATVRGVVGGLVYDIPAPASVPVQIERFSPAV